jgi:hypothetical protein
VNTPAPEPGDPGPEATAAGLSSLQIVAGRGPLPACPGKLYWSVTVYDAETRSQVQTDQGKAALRSMFKLNDKAGESTAEL